MRAVDVHVSRKIRRAPCLHFVLGFALGCASEPGPNPVPPPMADGGVAPRDAGAPPPERLTITTATLPPGRVGAAYSTMVESSGGSGVDRVWRVTAGALPDGLELAPEGRIFGTPTRPESAIFDLTVADSEAVLVTATFTVEISTEPPAILADTVQDGAITRRYEASVSAAGGYGPLSWQLVEGALPPGVRLEARTATAALAGVPETAGRYGFTLQVADRGGGTDEAAFEIEIVDDDVGVAPAENWARDIVITRLTLNATSGAATAEIVIGPSAADGVSFELRGPTVLHASTAPGFVRFVESEGRLDVGLPASTDTTTITIGYRSRPWEITGSHTFFPNLCGRAFPCRSAPNDASKYELSITGVAADRTAVYAPRLARDAVAFQVAWTVDELQFADLGTTAAGVAVGLYAEPDAMNLARTGARNLRASAEWMEQTFGPYPWGDRFANVVGGAAGGALETHPFPHLDIAHAAVQDTHVHELVHGWFGTGVRFACWEDVVFSEGTTTYLTARAIEATEGLAAAQQTWIDYEANLGAVGGRVAWPGGSGNGCNVETNLRGLYTSLPYFRGAFFFRSVEDRIGRSDLDAVLRNVFLRHIGEAIRFTVVLDEIRAVSGWDPTACVDKWLRAAPPPLPSEYDCP